MQFTPVLAHGADLLVLPILIAGIVTIMIALKDGKHKRPATLRLPATPVGRQVRAAMRVPATARTATSSARAPRSDRPSLQVLRDDSAKEPVARRWNG